MTFTAFVLIFASALLHATWNLLSKAQRPSLVFYLQANLTAILLWSPFLIFCRFDLTALPARFWLCYLASGLAEGLYFFGLANAYRQNDISLAYPMMRSIPVLLTGLLTALFGIGSALGPWCWLGMAIISAGCMIMPLQNFRQITRSTYCNSGFIFILIGACGTTGYTIMDKMGGDILMDAFGKLNPMIRACVFIGMLEIAITLPLCVLILLDRGERREFRGHFLHSYYPSLAGVCSSVAYMLVVLAMNYVSNVSYIQAFRQLSLPLCVAAGALLLKEKLSLPRILGVAALVTGLVLTVIR